MTNLLDARVPMEEVNLGDDSLSYLKINIDVVEWVCGLDHDLELSALG